MEKLRARDYRHMAHEKCRPQIGTLVLVTLLYIVITSVCSAGPLAVAILVIGGPLTLGVTVIICKKIHYGETVEITDMFEGFKDFADSLVLYLLRMIFIALWALLLIIPGIIKSYAYSMAFYIRMDKKLGANECITESRRIMDGHKWELFCLEISYIGWMILCVLTLGILSLWVMPRYNQAHYEFYLHITGQDVAPANDVVDADFTTTEQI